MTDGGTRHASMVAIAMLTCLCSKAGVTAEEIAETFAALKAITERDEKRRES